MQLAGSVALVTGAGRGLGRAFAERLAAQGCAIGVHGMREHGPAEYGEGTTLTDTAREIAEQFAHCCLIGGDLAAFIAALRRIAENVERGAAQEF